MPRKRSAKGKKTVGESQKPTQIASKNDCSDEDTNHGISNIKSVLENETTSISAGDGSNTTNSLNTNTAALHDELDLFRQRWKRELETKKPDGNLLVTTSGDTNKRVSTNEILSDLEATSSETAVKSNHATLKESFAALSTRPEDPQEVYNLAKRLFLIGVNLEQDEMHSESIRYYKQAIHLFPNIEKQLFREQVDASIASSRENRQNNPDSNHGCRKDDEDSVKVPILERIMASHTGDSDKGKFSFCKPYVKLKANALHISQLPHDLILKICHYVIGQELDLASLELFGMVCRGFYLISNDPSLWRNVCYRTWGVESFSTESRAPYQVDWRRMFIVKPKVNCDGVYISKTRYIRQGDVGFQDITYRPFHLIRYYRYMRFFTDRRVLILTTNEEPERIKPIFRHALSLKHFSPELSVLEGTYEFIEPNQVVIVAEKDFDEEDIMKHREGNRRQAHFHWSRQSPLNQKFSMKFELKTQENRPYRNNTLKWREYTIVNKFETGTEVTDFDLCPDTFPNLAFTRT